MPFTIVCLVVFYLIAITIFPHALPMSPEFYVNCNCALKPSQIISTDANRIHFLQCFNFHHSKKYHICSTASSSETSAVSARILRACLSQKPFPEKAQLALSILPSRHVQVSWEEAGGRAGPVMYCCILLGGLGGEGGDYRKLPPESFLLRATMSFLCLVTKGQGRLKAITLLAFWDSKPKSETNIVSNFGNLAFLERGCFLCSKEFWICSHHALLSNPPSSSPSPSSLPQIFC